jgi:hypothetical protein
VVRTVNDALDELASGVHRLDDAFPGLGDNVLEVGGYALAFTAAASGLSLVLPVVGAGFDTFLIKPARLFVSLLKGAADVLGIDIVAGLGVAGKAMDQFTATTLKNPLMRAAFIAFSLWDKVHEIQRPQDMTPEQSKQFDDWSKTHRWNPFANWGRGGFEGPDGAPPPINAAPGAGTNSGREMHEEGVGEVPVSMAPATQVSGTILVGVDPHNGQVYISRTDGTGVHLTPIYEPPDPGKTVGRP